MSSFRDYADNVRADMMKYDVGTPTREVKYTRKSDNVPTTLNANVSTAMFNKEDGKDVLSDAIYVGGLDLVQEPEVGDEVEFDGEIYKVNRHTKLGKLYTLYCSKSRRTYRA